MKPPACRCSISALALAADPEPRDLELELGELRRQPLVEAEVEERHAAVVEQQEVAGVRVAGELVVAVHAAEVEAEDDLARCGRAAPRRQLLSSSKPVPLTNSVTITRSRESDVTTSGTTMNGWPRKIRAIARWLEASSS